MPPVRVCCKAVCAPCPRPWCPPPLSVSPSLPPGSPHARSRSRPRRAARRERPPPGGPRASRRAGSQWARGLGGGRVIKGSAPGGARSRHTWTRKERVRYRYRQQPHTAPTAHRTGHCRRYGLGRREGVARSAAARRDSPRRPGAGAAGAAAPGRTWLRAAGRAPPADVGTGRPPGTPAWARGAARCPGRRRAPPCAIVRGGGRGRGGRGRLCLLVSILRLTAAGVSQAKCATNQTSRRWRNSTRRS